MLTKNFLSISSLKFPSLTPFTKPSRNPLSHEIFPLTKPLPLKLSAAASPRFRSSATTSPRSSATFSPQAFHRCLASALRRGHASLIHLRLTSGPPRCLASGLRRWLASSPPRMPCLAPTPPSLFSPQASAFATAA